MPDPKTQDVVEAVLLLGELVRRIAYRAKRSEHMIEYDELFDIVERELRNVKALLRAE